MPLYEYQCAKCGNVFEVIQKFSDQPLTVHEGCGGEVVRLISRSAFQLKGSGWYATDYAHKSSSSSSSESKSDSGKTDAKGDSSKADAGKGDSAKTESKADTKTESKSEAKSDSKPAPASSKSD